MYSTTQLQDEVIRLQIRIGELERENAELKQSNSTAEPLKVDQYPVPVVSPPIPPAPPAGIPPPPPPLIAKILRKPTTRKPNKKLRGLFWTKIRRPAGSRTSHSLWDQVEQQGAGGFLDDALCHTLEKEYCILERSSSLSNDKRSSKGTRYVEVLDSKRATNLSIQLSGLPPNWLRSLDELDMSALSEDQINQLKLALPSKEDLSDIETAQNNWPERELGAAEAFLLKLSSVTWAEERLTCWSFLLRCDTNANSIRKRCDLIRSAIFELRLDCNISKLMNLILTIGNYLNNGTGRGDAYGFHLSILQSLPSVKNNAKNSNLMSLLVEQSQGKQVLNEDFKNNIEIFILASKFQLTELESNISQELIDHATCLRMLDYVVSRDPNHAIVQVFGPLLSEHQSQLVDLKRDVALCRSEFNELLGWFGLNVSEMASVASGDFFASWSRFLESF